MKGGQGYEVQNVYALAGTGCPALSRPVGRRAGTPAGGPAPDTAAASQTDTPAAPAEEAAPDAAEPPGGPTEEVTKEVTATVGAHPAGEAAHPDQLHHPGRDRVYLEEDGLELEVAEVLPVEEISLAPDPDADASARSPGCL